MEEEVFGRRAGKGSFDWVSSPGDFECRGGMKAYFMRGSTRIGSYNFIGFSTAIPVCVMEVAPP